MNQSNLTCSNVKRFSRTLRVRALLTMFLTAVFVCSVPSDYYFYYHDSIIVHRDCPICKFLAIFPSGSETTEQQTTALDFTSLFPAWESLLIFSEILTAVPDSRAPPGQSFFADSRIVAVLTSHYDFTKEVDVILSFTN